MEREIMTTEEVSELFQVQTRTIKNWRDRGMPHFKMSSNIIRYDKEDVIEWAKQHTED